jgi:hypothetical protein
MMRWTGHVVCVRERRGVYRVLVGRLKGKVRRRWEDNIKMDLREMGFDGAKWNRLAQYRV